MSENKHPKDIVELAQWLKDGVLQVCIELHKDKWFDIQERDEVNISYPHDKLHHYRRRPEKKLRKWKVAEVPLGAWVRPKQKNSPTEHWISIITGRNPHLGADREVSLGGDGLCSCELLFAFDEHSIDQGKTWLPCGVEDES